MQVPDEQDESEILTAAVVVHQRPVTRPLRVHVEPIPGGDGSHVGEPQGCFGAQAPRLSVCAMQVRTRAALRETTTEEEEEEEEEEKGKKGQ